MKRTRSVIAAAACAAAMAVTLSSVPVHAKHDVQRFELVEATIADIQQAIDSHLLTAKQLVKMYQARIAAYDGKNTTTHLNLYIHLNPKAHAQADDSEARRGRPLSGVPMILKDNIDTADMPTTAGSVAFAGSIPRTTRSSPGSCATPARSSSARRR